MDGDGVNGSNPDATVNTSSKTSSTGSEDKREEEDHDMRGVVNLLAKRLDDAFTKISRQDELIESIKVAHEKEKEALREKYESLFEIIAENSPNGGHSAGGGGDTEKIVESMVKGKLQHFARRVAAKLKGMEQKLSQGSAENKIDSEEKRKILEESIRSELEAHSKSLNSMRSTVDSLVGLTNTQKATLLEWPQQLQVAVYGPLNDLTTKFGNLQQRSDKYDEISVLTEKSLSRLSEDLKGVQETVVETRRDFEKERKEGNSRARRLVDAQNKMRTFVLKQQSHQGEMTSAVRELQVICRGLKERIETSDGTSTQIRSKETGTPKQEEKDKGAIVEANNQEIDDLKRTVENLKASVESVLNREKTASTTKGEGALTASSKAEFDSKLSIAPGSPMRAYIDRRCAELAAVLETKFQFQRHDGNDDANVVSTSPTKSKIVDASPPASVRKKLFDGEDGAKGDAKTSAIYENASMLSKKAVGTPDVERAITKILDSSAASDTTAVASTGTPDMEKFLGRILDDEKAPRNDSTPDVEKLLGKILASEADGSSSSSGDKGNVSISSNRDSGGGSVARSPISSIRDAVSDIKRRLERQAAKLIAQHDAFEATKRLQDASLDSVKKTVTHLRESNRTNRSELASRIDSLVTSSDAKRDEIVREIESASLSVREIAHREAAAVCGREIENYASTRSTSKEESEKSTLDEFASEISEVRSAQERHAADLDRRCGEWTKKVAKNVQNQRRRLNDAVTKLGNRMEDIEARASKPERWTTETESLDRKLDRFALRQSHSLRQVQLSLEGITKKIVSEQISHSNFVEDSVASMEKRSNTRSEDAESSIRIKHASLVEELEESKEIAQAMSKRLSDEIALSNRRMDESIASEAARNKALVESSALDSKRAIISSLHEITSEHRQESSAQRETFERRIAGLSEERNRTYQELEIAQTKMRVEFSESSARLRDALLRKHVHISERLDRIVKESDESNGRLQEEIDERARAIRDEARVWRDDMRHLDESRMVTRVASLKRSFEVVRGEVEQLTVRVDSETQRRSQEAASLRARHVDVVDALVRTKRCQASMARTTASCRSIEQAVGRMQSRLCATEKRIPEIEEKMERTTEDYKVGIERLSEDIGTVSCSVADLKMGFDGIARPSLGPLVVSDSQLL